MLDLDVHFFVFVWPQINMGTHLCVGVFSLHGMGLVVSGKNLPLRLVVKMPLFLTTKNFISVMKLALPSGARLKTLHAPSSWRSISHSSRNFSLRMVVLALIRFFCNEIHHFKGVKAKVNFAVLLWIS